MAGRRKKLTEALEEKRLREIFAGMPENTSKVVDGLIVQAARLRVYLNDLNEDIAQNGLTELFQQSEKVEPYMRERPAAALFLKYDKNYQTVIRQLCDICPDAPKKNELLEFLKGD